MKIIALCTEGSCCPVVKIADDRVEIGEPGNLCVLTRREWEVLKDKIVNEALGSESHLLVEAVGG